MYWFIFDNRKKYHVNRMCKTLSVNEKGYYKWLRNGDKIQRWQELLIEIHKILAETPENDNYGVERIKIALDQKGIKVSKSTVRRAMKKGNLLKPNKRSPDGLTKKDKKAMQPKNLIKRNFTAEKPNQKWLTDITQVKCKDGKLYIAPIFDCFNGEIISLAMDTNMKKELCIKAVKDAFAVRNVKSSVIIHSDAGSQYTSEDYKMTLGQYRVIQSMSDVGKCYDNARMESFFATLKKEKLYRIKTKNMTTEQVKTEVFRYVMSYYNRKRITTVNPNGLPPAIYREQFEAQLLVA